ncbi:MAG: hypothetical protein OJF61_001738 [Rhodanobacteraceae bacterium]|nr:MAG: hypothetical protein OJF61_001738 [Rhodanobacteraceae bacterium]
MNISSENKLNALPGDDEVALRARAIFRTACEQTDSYHALRLGMARRKAVNAGSTHHAMKVWGSFAGAAACCALVAGVVWLRPMDNPQTSSSMAAAAPAAVNQGDADEVIPEVGSSQMEVVQDLDFYRWLAAQPAMASAAAPAASGRQ